MRILFLEASSGQVVGGSLTGMLQLIAGLDRKRYEPVVLLYEDKPVIRTLTAQGIHVRIFSKRRLPKEHALQEKGAYHKAKAYPGVTPILWNLRAGLTFLFETLPAALRLARAFQDEAPDLLHVCNGFRGNLDAIVAARMCGIPCIVHCKGFDKHSFVERLFAPGVASVICMTRAIEEHCRKQRIRAPKYTVIYDGLDLLAFQPTRTREDVREELDIAPDAPVVGVVGNIQPWKGQKVLLEALVQLLPTHPKTVVLIVGGAHRSGYAYAEELRTFVSQNRLEGHVVFTGAREDVGDLMSAMDIVAHTSVRGEPFGRVIIEGMCVGRPVVATHAGGVPEFVRDGYNGILVPAGDPSALAGVLRRLFDDDEARATLSANALESVQDFSVEHHVAQVTSIYDEVVSDGRTRRELPKAGRVASNRA